MSHPLIGRDVIVHWHDQRGYWLSYTVIDYYDGWILLRGRGEDGDEFEGGDVMVPMTDIRYIEVAETERAE